MQEIKPPAKLPESDKPKLFLAGSIEMGQAEHWQTHAVQKLADVDVLIFNPRRDAWDPSWEQTKDNPLFREQVEWELDGLAASDYVIMYFDPNTKSPISLLELGLFASARKLLVVCPEGFWRRGNVDIVCERYGIPQFLTIDAALEHFMKAVKK
jgi:hypothetical protein